MKVRTPSSRPSKQQRLPTGACWSGKIFRAEPQMIHCLYLSMHKYTCVCAHIYTHPHAHIHTNAHISTTIHTWTRVHRHTGMHTRSTWMQIHIHGYTHTLTWIHTHIYTFAHMAHILNTHVYRNAHIHVHTKHTCAHVHITRVHISSQTSSSHTHTPLTDKATHRCTHDLNIHKPPTSKWYPTFTVNTRHHYNTYKWKCVHF